MKFKAYQRIRRNRIENSLPFMGKADSELNPHSQEMLDDLRSDPRLSFTTHKRLTLLGEKQHSS
jgi:hypothetical protein